MAQSRSDTGAPSRSRSTRRTLMVGGIVVLVLLVAWLAFGRSLLESFQTSTWIRTLYSGDPDQVQAARRSLEQSDAEGLNEKLLEVLKDDTAGFRVRRMVGGILLKRNRLGLVESALRSEELGQRIAALAVLYDDVPERGLEWFRRDYVDRPEYRVPRTVLAWLDREQDASRAHAVGIAAALQMKEALPAIRGLIGRAELQGATVEQQRLVIEAAMALLQMGDCESVARFVEPALTEQVDVVRLRMMQALHRATLARGAPCPGAVPREKVKEVVFAALDGPTNTRHGAVLLLRHEPAWVAEQMDRLLAFLGDESEAGPFRRSVLDTLVAAGPPEFVRALPGYFHDASPLVRSSAVAAATEIVRGGDAPVRFEDCWIGLLQRETESEQAFYGALSGLRRSAGAWLDLPEDLAEASIRAEPTWLAFRKDLFQVGESRGVERQAWARRWFLWWAERLGLSGTQAEEAWTAREAFWRAAGAGDPVAAKAALADVPDAPDGLFTDELGWLERAD